MKAWGEVPIAELTKGSHVIAAFYSRPQVRIVASILTPAGEGGRYIIGWLDGGGDVYDATAVLWASVKP